MERLEAGRHGRVRAETYAELQARAVALKEANERFEAQLKEDADHHMEGVYWLVRVLGSAFPAPSRLVHATSVFEEGWLIVQVHGTA